MHFCPQNKEPFRQFEHQTGGFMSGGVDTRCGAVKKNIRCGAPPGNPNISYVEKTRHTG
jgi:hypothetical protein